MVNKLENLVSAITPETMDKLHSYKIIRYKKVIVLDQRAELYANFSKQ